MPDPTGGLIGNPALVGIGVVTLLLNLVGAFYLEYIFSGKAVMRIIAKAEKDLADCEKRYTDTLAKAELRYVTDTTELKKEIQNLTQMVFRLMNHAETAIDKVGKV